MKKHLFIIFVSLLLISIIGVSPVRSSTTIIYVNPSSIIDTAKVTGTAFTIDINVKDVTDLYTFDFRLNYSTTVLDIAASALGALFPAESFMWKNETNDALGYTRFLVGLPLGTPKGGGLSGSGTLMTLNFTVTSSGGTRLDLSSTELIDSYANLITHTAYDGYFSNKPGLPMVYVSPESVVNTDLVPSKNFTIDVNVVNATEFFISEFKLSYDPALLETANVSEGDFLKSFGPTSFITETNETEGVIRVNITLTSSTAGAAGDGTLAKITFNITDIGRCVLHLHDTELVDSERTLIDHATVDGYFSNRPVVHDLIITEIATTVSTVSTAGNVSIAEPKPVSEVHTGDHVNVTVTVKNNGTETETFDVTAYYGDTAIRTKNGTVLLEGASVKIPLEWDTEGVAVGSYEIWAQTSTILGEINTANNKLTQDGKFTVLASGSSIPIELVVGVVVAVIVVVALAVYFLKIRKPKTSRTIS